MVKYPILLTAAHEGDSVDFALNTMLPYLSLNADGKVVVMEVSNDIPASWENNPLYAQATFVANLKFLNDYSYSDTTEATLKLHSDKVASFYEASVRDMDNLIRRTYDTVPYEHTGCEVTSDASGEMYCYVVEHGGIVLYKKWANYLHKNRANYE